MERVTADPTSRLGLDQRRHAGTFIDLARMRDATVLVGGCGALGNEVVKNLAMMSVGRLLLVDFDHVEDHNLPRSVFFFFGDTEAAIAQRTPKARFVGGLVRACNPDVAVAAISADIADLGAGVYRRLDVAVSCFDGVEARYVMNDRCTRASIPMVDGGLHAREIDSARGQVKVFDPRVPETACYACGLPVKLRTELADQIRKTQRPPGCSALTAFVEARGGVPSSILLASIVGGMQALEATRLICARSDIFAPQAGVALRFNLARLHPVDARSFCEPRDPGCPHHEPSEAESLALPLSSASASLADLARCAAEHLGRPVRVQLPGRFLPLGECTACSEVHAWVSMGDNLLAAAHLERGEDAVVPPRLRLPCGCPRGLARTVGPHLLHATYGLRPDLPAATTSLRASRIPWMHEFPLCDAEGHPLGIAAHAAHDWHALTGWSS